MSAAAETLAPSSATREFLDQDHKLFINGRWQRSSSSERTVVVDPATEVQITTTAIAGEDDVEQAVAAARAAFKGEWSKIDSHNRTRLLLKFADAIDANMELFSELEVLDNGMPVGIAAYCVRKAGSDFLRYYAGWCTKIHGQTIQIGRASCRERV